jgi:hypothetical protein
MKIFAQILTNADTWLRQATRSKTWKTDNDKEDDDDDGQKYLLVVLTEFIIFRRKSTARNENGYEDFYLVEYKVV